ncbi:Ser/Thr protein phosphatase protein [Cubamyces sp. BRFM 1775]|nr:Ser/Thr protein phosphatase protein [Cubamyces sp. BRFM 1775]
MLILYTLCAVQTSLPHSTHQTLHPMAESTEKIGIQILSDLHLDFERPSSNGGPGNDDDDGNLYKFDFPARAEHLALLGDIGMTVDDRLFTWLRAQLERFKTVFFVPGNHEPYWSSLDESNNRLAQFAAECASSSTDESNTSPKLGRFVLLDRTRHDLSPTLTVLGCTLWARLDPNELDVLRWGVNDFRRIEGFDPDAFQAAHARDAAWLAQAVADVARDEPERRVVVMTHHAPTVEGTSDPRYAEGPTGSAFATELVGSEVWRKEVVRVWMFGHTHWCCDFEREGVRVVSNQRGYKQGAPGFELDKVIEV